MLSSLPGCRLLYLKQPVAINMYIASHLEGQPPSSRTVRNLFGGPSPDLLFTFGIVRQTYNGIIGELSWKILNVVLD